MKIAIPTKADAVDDHFGHCEAYTIFTIGSDNNITHSEILPSPKGCGCKSNIAAVLKDIDVKIMLAGSMGNGALNVLNQHDIEVVRGCSGNVKQLIEAYLNNQLNDSGYSCDHHGSEGHQCNH